MQVRALASILWCLTVVDSAAAARHVTSPIVDPRGEWDFAIDVVPVKEGEAYMGPPFEGPYEDWIEVPGNWNVRMWPWRRSERPPELGQHPPLPKRAWWTSLGPGWYHKRVVILEKWRGKEVHLVVGGVMRRAKGWLNGVPIGEHDGFSTPFRWNMTDAVRWGEPNDLIIMVDARRLPESNLEGCMIYQAQWGGMFRHVYIEAVPALHITDVFVVPDIDREKVAVHVRTTKDKEPSVRAHVSVKPASGRGRSYSRSAELEECDMTFEIAMSGARLWSPDDPFLYEARVILITGRGVVDFQSVRFGIRKIEARDGRFYLNNSPIFLRGYGNDCVYPLSGSPPVDRKRHLRDFRKAKELGFIYVRHHSWTPPLEYVEAADEAGMLLQLELPDAYRGPEGQEELLKKELERIILHYRNHPSVIAYCLGNEADGPESYIEECREIVRRLDPTRLFQSFDHYTMPPEPTDYLTTTFDQTDGPFHSATEGIERVAKDMPKPIIFHEMGNFSTFPHLRLLPKYRGYYDGYWLRDLYDRMESARQRHLSSLMHRNSCRYQALAHKLMIEAARASENLDGYQLWLITDFPGEGIAQVGVFNNFWEHKGGTTVRKFRHFNDDSVLLLDGWNWNHRSGEAMKHRILISHYRKEPIRDGTLMWSLGSGTRILEWGKLEGLSAECYTLNELATIQFDAPAVSEPMEAYLRVSFWGKHGATIMNEWPQFFYPKRSKDSLPQIVSDIENDAFVSRYPVRLKKTSGNLLFVTKALSQSTVNFLLDGGRVLLLSGTRPTRFRPAWWNQPQPLGHVIREHPAMAGVPHEGWAALQFYWLLEGARMIGKEGQPPRYEPIFYVINRDGTTDGGLVSEFQVGKGRLMICGLNVLSHLDDDPASLILLDRMTAYLSGDKLVSAPAISLEDLEAMGLAPLPDVTGFSAAIQSAEKRLYSSFLGNRMMYITRSLEGAAPLVWRTKPVAKTLPPGQMTTFTWIGGCGWVSQPESTFTLLCNGRPVLDLFVKRKSAQWGGAERSVLEYRVKGATAEDSSGIFSLTVPNAWLEPGQEARLEIVGHAAASQRWFAVYDVK